MCSPLRSVAMVMAPLTADMRGPLVGGPAVAVREDV